jgi:hypothetical protein
MSNLLPNELWLMIGEYLDCCERKKMTQSFKLPFRKCRHKEAPWLNKVVKLRSPHFTRGKSLYWDGTIFQSGHIMMRLFIVHFRNTFPSVFSRGYRYRTQLLVQKGNSSRRYEHVVDDYTTAVGFGGSLFIIDEGVSSQVFFQEPGKTKVIADQRGFDNIHRVTRRNTLV